MPLVTTSPSSRELPGVESPEGNKPSFLFFSSDVVNGELWCPGCRQVDPTIKDTFDGDDKPKALVYYVGTREQWKGNAEHEARTRWNVQTVPTILRFEDGKETARLNGSGILDAQQFQSFIKPE